MRYSRDLRARQTVGRRSLTQRALAILARYGSASNLYLPGVGTINGITAGNWLDSTGVIPATVDNPVGLVFSGINNQVGGELVIDGGFGSGSNWQLSGGSTISGGVLNCTTTPSVADQLSAEYQSNKTYLVTYTTSGPGVANIIIFGSGSYAIHACLAGTNTVVLHTNIAGGSQVNRLRIGGSTSAGWIDNVSIKSIGGSHLTQSTTANKPILRLSNGVYSWEFISGDSLNSVLTPGNTGFVCTAANITDSGVLRTLLGAGAGSDASSGVWLTRQVSSNMLMLQVGNGTTRNSIGAPYPVASNAVASAGWDSSNMFVGINSTETSGVKSVNCTSTNTMNIGVLTGTTNPMLGTIGATIIMSVLPTISERTVLRKFIAALSGVTL